MNILNNWTKPQYLLQPKQIVNRIFQDLFLKKVHTVEVKLPWKVHIRVNTKEVVGRYIWHNGIFDLEVSEAIGRLLKPGDYAIDVGANIGYITSLMACRVGSTGNILSFEAHPIIYGELKYNISLFEQKKGIGKINAFEVALSDTDGEANLICGNDFAQNQGSAKISEIDHLLPNQSVITVKKKKLDDYIFQKEITILKLDVEGHELQVLLGSVTSLKSKLIKNIIYEDHIGSKSPVHKLLQGFGYTIYLLGWETFKPTLSNLEDDFINKKKNESPNYIATLDPIKLKKAFTKLFWNILK